MSLVDRYIRVLQSRKLKMNQRIFYFLLCDAFIFLLTYRKAEETPTYL